MKGQDGMTQPRVCAPFSFFLFDLYHEIHLDSLSFSSGFLKVPGADLQNICTLQIPEDSSKILKLATGKNVVIVGASFIGTRLEWVSNHQREPSNPLLLGVHINWRPSGKGCSFSARLGSSLELLGVCVTQHTLILSSDSQKL